MWILNFPLYKYNFRVLGAFNTIKSYKKNKKAKTKGKMGNVIKI